MYKCTFKTGVFKMFYSVLFCYCCFVFMYVHDNFPRVNMLCRQRRRCVHKGLKNEQGRDASAVMLAQRSHGLFTAPIGSQ